MYYCHVNTASDQTPIPNGWGVNAVTLLAAISAFRVTNPATPIEITDLNGTILVNEDREQRL